jgi:hypothetical protein
MVAASYGRGSHATWSRMWWGGGWYSGGWYGPGWYYPWAVYPGYWYWNGWAGYRYEYAPYASGSGIKFDLGQVPKADRKTVAEAGVYLPDENGKGGYLGSVGNFSEKWHKALPLAPGNYDLTVALADGRAINLTVAVQPGRVTHVALRLDQPPVQQSAVGGGNDQKLVPAPPPPPAK